MVAQTPESGPPSVSFTTEEEFAIQQARIWPRFLAFPLAAIAGEILFFAGVGGDAWYVQLTWVIGLTYCWFCVGGLTHELVHQTLPISRTLCVRLGIVIGTFLGMPDSAYRIIHVRHHAYLNTPLDFELWPYSDPRRGIWFRRAFVWFDILAGFIASPLIYLRILIDPASPITSAERRQLIIEYVYVAVFWGSVGAVLGFLQMNGTLQLSAKHLICASPLLLAASANSMRKLIEHLGMASYDPVEGTRTIIGRRWWTRWASYFDFDLSIHGPHHRYAKRPHDQLAESMRQLQLRDPARKYLVFPSYAAAVWNVLPCLFRNPGVGVNAGNTASLTHVSQVNHFTTDAVRDVVSPDGGGGEALIRVARTPGFGEPPSADAA